MSSTPLISDALLLEKHYEKTVWARFVTIFLGIWLLAAPFTFGYESPTLWTGISQTGIAPKTVEAIQVASQQMVWSDLITGVLVVLFGCLSLSCRRFWPSWALCFLGIWLQFAPILFWAPGVAMYLNDTLVGVLLIGFSVLVTKLPYEGPPSGPDIPPGWSYNPSSWLQRLPVIAFGCFGWMIARYLAAYQLGYIPQVWDPFFGTGTLKVITSDLSRSFPISDAGLGAVAYSLEALMGCKGSSRRWRTMPWMVIFFGILVVPLGFCSILLVMMQPIVVGAWCGLCLCAAAAMLVMMALTVDEVVAVSQVLCRANCKGMFWKIFWKGDHEGIVVADTRTPAFTSENGKFKAVFWGAASIPWNLFLTALVGAVAMVLPALFPSFGKALSNNTHVFGALTITLSILSWAEVTRFCRFALLPIGFWFIASAWIWREPSVGLVWNSGSVSLLFVGALLLLLSWRRGRILETYGTWSIR